MNSAQYLDQTFRYNKYIGSKIEKLVGSKQNLTASYSDSPHSAEFFGRTMETSVIEQISTESILRKDFVRYLELQTELEKMILNMKEDRYKFIIRRRYMDALEWAEIAEMTNYSLRYLYKLHKRAVIEFDVVYNQFMAEEI
ncbi:MAG: hypothetical protein Q4E35_07255 [Eubacteriales bacterium]|nr:hypothetical protein [Eubacteriales bacterium]